MIPPSQERQVVIEERIKSAEYMNKSPEQNYQQPSKFIQEDIHVFK